MQKQLSPATAIVIVLIVVIIVVVVGYFVFLKPKKSGPAMSPDEMKAQMEKMGGMPGMAPGGVAPPGGMAPGGTAPPGGEETPKEPEPTEDK